MASDEVNIKRFDAAANNRSLWILHGNDLHLSSQVLRERVGSVHVKEPETIKYAGLAIVAPMLQGFAIEALLKAYFLHCGNTLSSSGKYSLPSMKRDAHQLQLIARAVGYSISLAEQEVLARLSLIVSSYGRYPVTKRWQQNRLAPDEHGVLHRLSWSDNDHAVSETLIERLKSDLRPPPRKG